MCPQAQHHGVVLVKIALMRPEMQGLMAVIMNAVDVKLIRVAAVNRGSTCELRVSFPRTCTHY